MATDGLVTVPLSGGLEFGSFMSSDPRIVYTDGLVAIDGTIREAGCFNNNTDSTVPGGATSKLLDAKFIDGNGFNPCFVFTDRRIYAVVPGGGFGNLSPGGVDFANASTSWQSLLFGDTRVIATSKENVLVSSVSAAAFAALATSPEKPQGRCIATAYAHCFLANIKEAGVDYPNRVWWSARNNAAVWTPGTDRAGYIDIIGGGKEIVAMFGFFDYVIVIKDGGVYRMNYTGGPTTFQLQQIAGSTFGGVSSSWGSAGVIGRDIFYLTTRGPAIIRNGEVAELLSPALASPLSSLIHPEHLSSNIESLALLPGADSAVRFFQLGQSAAWCGASYSNALSAGTASTFRRIVTYDPTSGLWAASGVYSVANGSASSVEPSLLVEDSIIPFATTPDWGGVTWPIPAFRNISALTYTAAGSLRLRRCDTSAAATIRAPITVRTSRIVPAAGSRVLVTGAVWEADTVGTPASGGNKQPIPTFRFRANRFPVDWGNTSTANFNANVITTQAHVDGVVTGQRWPFEAGSFTVEMSLTAATSPRLFIRSLGNLHVFFSGDTER